MKSSWTNDWATFVHSVSADHIEGATDLQISQKYGDSIVRWSGKIAELKLKGKYARGVRMVMPKISIALDGYRYIEAEHLYLVVNQSTAETWSSAQLGSEVEFETRLIVSNAIFNGISLATFDDGMIDLQIGARESRMLHEINAQRETKDA